jgi:glycosyltransferase involved in cell wall biosynthesis
LLLAGDGVLRDELKAEVENLGIKNNVLFTGVRNDMEKLYAISHISVLPSDREGFSNVIVESMASGLPVIATDVGGNSEAIMDGQNGYIIKRDDDKMLAERIITLLKNENLRKKMADESIKRVELFSLEKMKDKTEELYQSLYNKWIHRGLNSKVR